jgi:hypothetical protein
MVWSTPKLLEILSALSGAGGTVLLFKGTFGFEAPPFWSSPKLEQDMAVRNRKRWRLQNVGLLLLLLSFLLGLAHVFVE